MAFDESKYLTGYALGGVVLCGKKVLQGQAKVLQFHAHPKYSRHEYVIYA